MTSVHVCRTPVASLPQASNHPVSLGLECKQKTQEKHRQASISNKPQLHHDIPIKSHRHAIEMEAHVKKHFYSSKGRNVRPTRGMSQLDITSAISTEESKSEALIFTSKNM